ncbi:DivIVA domain-containing protein [Nocardia sp. NBC_01730]|uniref:DivIVA domain-containing protein n=1 Tax=Nocardia sp. NBC_01730 TaxID=2975998 RepID=UPI002E0E70AC|nr:DivIVA domain-containing protein [Nocardia sp. NBC_01730]
MPLTPDDIRNVQFGKPRFGQRGYDPEDVDRLLDDVESTLRTLYARIAQLERTTR